MKRIISILLAAVLMLSLAACNNAAQQPSTPDADATPAPAAEPTPEATPETTPEEQVTPEDAITIGIIQLTEHAALDLAREGFLQALADNGYVDGDKINIDFQNAQNDQSTLSTISDRFVSEEVDLVLAIATPAAQAIAGKTTEIPILATAVTDFVVAKLVESNEVPGGNVSGTTDMNPIEDQIDLLMQLVPEAKTIGLIYNSGEDNSVLQAQIATAAIEARNLAVTEVTVTSTNDVQQAMQSLVTKCDAIYIPTDNTLASSMPIVEGVCSESKTPVICGESSMVESGGLATLSINYYKLGYQTGLMALRILVDGADISTMPIETLEDMDLAFNLEVADSIGLTIPEELLAKAGN